MKRCYWVAVPFAICLAMVVQAQGGGAMGGNMAAAGGKASLSDGIKQGYTGVKTNLMAAANAMPDDGYTFIPSNGERNFGGWVGHVAQAQLGTCTRIAGGTPDSATMAMLQGVNSGTAASKADLVAALQKSFDACDAVYNALDDSNAADAVPGRGVASRISALAGNVAHDNECYGSMAVYLRLKGIVPPSTAARGGGMRGGAPPAGGR